MIQVTLKAEDIDTLVAGGCITQNGVAIRLTIEVHQATGLELREFYQNGWDGDYYYESDDAVIQIENDMGEWIAEDNRVYNLRDLGILCWQGTGTPQSKGKPDWLTFEEAFTKWKNAKR